MLIPLGLSSVNSRGPTTASTLSHRTGSGAWRCANSSVKRPPRCSTSRTSRDLILKTPTAYSRPTSNVSRRTRFEATPEEVLRRGGFHQLNYPRTRKSFFPFFLRVILKGRGLERGESF